MNFRELVPARRRSPLIATALVACVVSVGAGEKAKISLPSDGSVPSNLGTAKPTFKPLEGGNSIGGVVDDAAAIPAVPLNSTLDPRTQRELMERMDRRRNFLLDDSSNSKGLGNMPALPESADAWNAVNNQRRPQTVLERRLRGSAEPGRTTTASPSVDSMAEFDDNALIGGLPTSANVVNLPGWTSGTRSGSLDSVFGSGTSGSIVPTAISGSAALSSSSASDSYDAFMQSRQERFEQSFGKSALTDLQGGLGGLNRLGTSTPEVPVVPDSSASLPNSALSSPVNPAMTTSPLARNPDVVGNTFNTLANPYAPPVNVTPPPPSAAQQFRRTPPRLELPTFRP